MRREWVSFRLLWVCDAGIETLHKMKLEEPVMSIRSRKAWAFLLALSLSLSPLAPVGYAFAEEGDGEQQINELIADDGSIEGIVVDGSTTVGNVDTMAGDDIEAVVDDTTTTPDTEGEAGEPVLTQQADTVALINDSAEYSSLQEAADAAVDGEIIKLVKDIELNECVYFNNKVRLDLNGHCITNVRSGSTAPEQSTICAVKGVDVTDSSADRMGTIRHTGNDGCAINGKDDVSIGEDVTIESTDGCGILQEGGTLRIYSGMVSGKNVGVKLSNVSQEANASIEGGTIFATDGVSVIFDKNDANSGEFVISGGNFGDAAGNDGAKFTLPLGMSLQMADGEQWYTLKDAAIAMIGETQYATLADAIDAANSGDTIYIIHDGEIPSTMIIQKDLTIKMNGHTLIADIDLTKRVFDIRANLTLEGEGTITKTTSNLVDLNAGSLTIDGPTLHTDGALAVSTSYLAAYLVPVTLTLKSGTISSNLGHAIEFLQPRVTPTVIITGGTVKSGDTAVYYSCDYYDASLSITGGTFNGKVTCDKAKCITGGTFRTADDSAALEVDTYYLADGYEQDMDTGVVSYTGPVAMIGETSYWSLEAAIDDAQNGDTITMVHGTTLDSPLHIDKSITIDFNGCTVSTGFDSLVTKPVFDVYGNGAITLTGEGTLTTDHAYAIALRDSGAVTVDGPTVHAGAQAAIGQHNGATGGDSVSVTVRSGAVSSDGGRAVDLIGNASSTVTVEGGTLSGAKALSVPRPYGSGATASVSVTGGELAGTEASLEVGTDVAASVTGGSFSGPVSSFTTTRFVSGGTFLAADGSAPLELNEDYIAEGYEQDMNTGKVVPADQVPAFVKQQLVLTGQVGLTAFLRLPENIGVDWSQSSVTFEVSGKNHRTVEVPYSESVRNSDGTLRGFTVQLSSVEMAQPITVTLHYTQDGEEFTLTKEDVSVESYIKKFDEAVEKNPGDYDEKTVALVHAVADYGHYVQPFLSKQNKWALGDGDDQYVEMGIHYEESYDRAAMAAELSGYGMLKDLDGSAVTKATAALLLESETALDVNLTTEGGVKPADVTVKVGDGKAVELEPTKSGKKWRVRVEGIRAHDLDKSIVVTGTAGEGEFTVTVSPLAYAGAILEAGTYGTEAENAMCALWQYHLAAKAYADMH